MTVEGSTLALLLLPTISTLAMGALGPIEDGIPLYFKLDAYNEYIMPGQVDDINDTYPYFFDHRTAVQIPMRVYSYTTADLYREGYRQRRNCRAVLANDFSNRRRPGARQLNNATDEQRLMCTLMQNYSAFTRPVPTANSLLVVNFSLAINQIFDLDDRNQQLIMSVWYEQTWKDQWLTWNPHDFGGMTGINIPSYYIFVPDIELYNSANNYKKRRMQFRAMVRFDGTVFYGNPVRLVSTCQVNPTWYPFDTQICRLKFGSWTFSGHEIDLQPSRSEVDTSRSISNGKWDLVRIVQRRHSIKYTCCDEPYIDISYYIVLRRKPLYYLLNVYFFTVTLAVMTLAVYQLPINSGEKCSLGTAVLFSVSVFMLSCTEKLPESSDYVPIINVYLFLIMAMSSISLMMTIGINAIHFQNSRTLPTSSYAKIVKVPFTLMKLVHFWRRIQGATVCESVRRTTNEYEKKKSFIKKLRCYQRCIDFEKDNIGYLSYPDQGFLSAFPTSHVSLYNLSVMSQINEISMAIEKLADAYEVHLSRGFNLLEWHELAEIVDRILFWIFCFLLLVAVSFVLGYASIRDGHEDDDKIIDLFDVTVGIKTQNST